MSRTAFFVVFLLAVAAQAASSRPATTTIRARSGGPAGARPARKNAPVDLFQVNLRERMQLRLRDTSGRPIRGQQKRFDRFLRCHYTNVQHPMNPRLISLIYRTGRHWPGHRVEVVSGYRHPKYAKNPRSPHMKGLACDFRVAGVSNTALRDYLRHSFDKVGVGYYPNSSFVHLDIRKDHSAFWIDYSGPGERALYSPAPGDDLRSGRAEHFHPSKIDTWWVDAEQQSEPQAGRRSDQIGEARPDLGAPDPAPAAPAERPTANP